MKKSIVAGVSLLVLLAYAPHVGAHESTGTDHETLLVHVDPNDVAVAGRPTTVHVDIRNKEKGFSLKNCHCSLYVEQDEKRLFTFPLTPTTEPGIYDAMGVEVTFPSAGTYNVGVEGTPITAGAFSPFTLEVEESVLATGTDPYSVQASSTDDHPSHNQTFPVLEALLTATCLLVLLYFVWTQRGLNRMR